MSPQIKYMGREVALFAYSIKRLLNQGAASSLINDSLIPLR